VASRPHLRIKHRLEHACHLLKITGAGLTKILHHIAMREPAVYIMASERNGTLYVGVTSDIGRRAFEHREGVIPGFTKRHRCKMLVWYEFYDSIIDAIAREKNIKGQSRNFKLQLIEDLNPEWKDLFETIA
jgi:predicted GIY-YIG superfamily endonuclease